MGVNVVRKVGASFWGMLLRNPANELWSISVVIHSHQFYKVCISPVVLVGLNVRKVELLISRFVIFDELVQCPENPRNFAPSIRWLLQSRGSVCVGAGSLPSLLSNALMKSCAEHSFRVGPD